MVLRLQPAVDRAVTSAAHICARCNVSSDLDADVMAVDASVDRHFVPVFNASVSLQLGVVVVSGQIPRFPRFPWRVLR